MTIKNIQLIYFSVWIIPILLASGYSLGWLGERTNTCDEATKYIITIILDLMTFVTIYCGVKLMKFKIVSHNISKHIEKAFSRYYLWNLLRHIAFLAVIFASFYIYMYTCNDSGLYTALMILCAHVFCYPSEQECSYIINSTNTQEKK